MQACFYIGIIIIGLHFLSLSVNQSGNSSVLKEMCLKCKFAARTCKSSDEADADAVVIVARCVGADPGPATSLVHVAVLADQKTVSDVRPPVGVHVVVLVGPNNG